MSSSQRLWQNLHLFPTLIAILLIYLGISALQTWHQSSVSINHIEQIDFSQSPISLCVRYPDYLTRDGEQQQGILSLRLIDPLITEQCSIPNAQLISSLATPAASVSTALISSVPITAPAIYTFTLFTSPTLTFINQQGLSFSPIITLNINEERSVTVRHAQLSDGGLNSQITILENQSGEQKSLTKQVRLEGRILGLGWRKFRNIVLAPAGILAALGLVVIQELRKLEEQTKDADKRRIEVLREEANEIQSQTDGSDLFPRIRKWVNSVTSASPRVQHDADVRRQLGEGLSIIIDKYISYTFNSTQNFIIDTSEEIKVLKHLLGFVGSNWDIDPIQKQRITALDNELNAHRSKLPRHFQLFSDPMLTGFYLNRAWAQRDRRGALLQQINLLQSLEQSNFCDSFMKGIWASQKMLQDNSSSSSTLFHDLWNGSLKGRNEVLINLLPQLRKNLVKAFDKLLQSSPELATYAKLQQLITKGLSSVRLLWPLPVQNRTNGSRSDANFDFPADIAKSDDEGIISQYQLGPSLDMKVGASDLCEQHLYTDSHSIVIGRRHSGKTWLRIYLEYYLLRVSPASLVSFYFPLHY